MKSIYLYLNKYTNNFFKCKVLIQFIDQSTDPLINQTKKTYSPTQSLTYGAHYLRLRIRFFLEKDIPYIYPYVYYD